MFTFKRNNSSREWKWVWFLVVCLALTFIACNAETENQRKLTSWYLYSYIGNLKSCLDFWYRHIVSWTSIVTRIMWGLPIGCTKWRISASPTLASVCPWDLLGVIAKAGLRGNCFLLMESWRVMSVLIIIILPDNLGSWFSVYNLILTQLDKICKIIGMP